MEDNFESGWVSVRPKVFDETERHKFAFIVAWNDIEEKFAITCHNRTVQRRTTFLDPLLECSPVDALPVHGASVAEKHNTNGVKIKQDELCQEARTRPHSFPKGRGTKCEAWDKKPSKAARSKTIDNVNHNMGSWDIVATPKAVDMEILEPIEMQGLLSPVGIEPGDSEGSGHEDFSWAGLFSFQDLRAAHLQLCAVNSDLEPCLPPFPEEQFGVWTVMFGSQALSQREREALCYQLQVYLGHALDTCGWKILSQVLFSEGDDTEEYYESLSELRQKGYEDALERAKRHMHEVLEKHKAIDSMVDLLHVYPEEDEAYNDLLEATTQLYHYLLQPFRDMRELAMLRRQQIKISLETERLGPRRVESLRREDEEWQKKAHAAVMSIQDLTVKFFETTTRAQKALYERMKVDQKKFGKSAWAAAVDRMERLQYSVSKETLQLMRAKEICLEQRKHSLKEEMQSLRGGEEAMLRVDELEALYYELQLQLYDIQSEVLRCEELLLTAQLQSLRRQMTERQDEVVYYDAFESPDAMKGKTRQLEARRGRITAKKVYLKNKKEICIANHKQKSQQTQGSFGESKSQQAVNQGDADDEAQRNARVSQERQRTLDRLRSLRQRYPGQVTLKSSRFRQTQTKRRGLDPVMQVASVQTEASASLPSESPAPLVADVCDTASLPPAPALEDTVFSPPFFSVPPLSASPSLSLGEQQQDVTKEKLQSSPVQQKHSEPECPPLSLAPFSPRFFDSSQLLTARKKLRKTSSQDSSQWRRASSPMDEVLASLKRGSFHLRKAELRVLAPDPDDDGNNILAQIRQGVRLRKVRARPEQQRHGKSFPHSTDALTRSIHEALRRIKEASPESESEDEGLPCTDWEN
ncbi:hypothetical protein WMY93_021223 [Mugilogobius chulae]|uniref:WH2 domain-containing protein n=1 Tax=Mugilogobius chulae TaxID=88201 RepID=A0AAW0NA51_9GOBI